MTDDPEPPPPPAGDLAATYCATLVDEWVALGLRHAVVAPGSRSTPLALALLADGRLRVEVVLDERAAAFVALGAAAASGVPALVLCTSGTAAAEFHAAVVEAHQSAVPLLVVTADRPPELQGVWAPQTIDQRRLYGDAVRWYCEPGPPEAGGAPWWRDLARDALSRTLGVVPGPVHLNLAFREPLVGVPGELPERVAGAPALPPDGAEWGLTDEELGRLAAAISGRRGVLVAGVRTARNGSESAAVHQLADALGWPVICDALSGCRDDAPGVVACSDLILRDPATAELLRPEVVIRTGGLLASKVLAQWLAASGALQVGLDRADRVPDPDRLLSRSLVADPAVVAAQLARLGPAPADRDWSERWVAAEASARGAVRAGIDADPDPSEPSVAVDVLASVPDGGALVVASSMPVRDLEWFAPPRPEAWVWSNRGANGIDGVVSTALGVATTGRVTTVVVGDLAFLHDSTALVGLRDREVDLVVVVVDNDGGGIFSFLPQRGALDPEAFERLFGTPHGSDLVALAEAHGLPAERVRSRAGLQAALAGARARGGVRVVVVDSDRDRNVAVHARLVGAVAAALARDLSG
jgi:2-succinyl-5-enolpyruvyl-6-hydroxy-3-cyclohexene-1-carboxylate synthase